MATIGVVVMGCLLPGRVNADPPAFSGQGLGTTEYPYRITDCLQLQEMNNAPSASYVLMNNIDCGDAGTGNDTTTWDSGKGFLPIGTGGYFNGTFDGRNHNITNFFINRPTENHIGLFGISIGASIKNVSIDNAVVSGQNFVGILGGTMSGTSVEFVQVQGEVDGAFTVGGLAGRMDDHSSLVGAMVNTTVTNTGQYTGGVVGLAGDTILSDVSAFVEVTGSGWAGAVSGYVYADTYDAGLMNIAVYGSVSGAGAVGGGVGRVEGYSHQAFFSDLAIHVQTSGYALFGNRGTAPSTISVSDVHYEADTQTGYPGQCNQDGESGCTSENADGENPGNWFGYYNSHLPYTNWDFVNTWESPSDGVLFLREQALDDLASLDAPGEIVPLSVTPVDAHSIEVSWEPSATQGSGAPTNYLIEYSVSGSGNWQSFDPQGSMDVNGNPVTVVIDGLNPNTDYEIQIAQVNFAGAGPTNNPPMVGGTADPATTITTCTELQEIQFRLDVDYVLGNDIDCADTEGDNDTTGWNNGLGFAPIGYGDVNGFTGTFDGRGYKISGMYQDRSIEQEADANVGLFWLINDGSVRNVTLEDSVLIGKGSGGSFASRAYRTDFYNVASSADITVTGGIATNDGVGGITGVLSGGNISFDREDSTIEVSKFQGIISGENSVGGVVGYMYYGLLANTYSNSTIVPMDGGLYYGGLAGYQLASLIDDSYSSSSMSIASDDTADVFGGISGAFRGFSVLSNVFATNFMGINSAIPDGGHAGSIIGQNIDNNPENFTEVYYDDSSGHLECMDGAAASGCSGASVDSFGSKDNPPLTGWDFVTIWAERQNQFPDFDLSDMGTPVYDIYTCDDLQSMRYDKGGSYQLKQDIDCSQSYEMNNNTGFQPVGSESRPFTGTLDGSGYSIVSLNMNLPTANEPVGVFGTTKNAELYNITTIGESATIGPIGTGTLIGHMIGGVVQGVHNYSPVYALYDGGGIVGVAECSSTEGVLLRGLTNDGPIYVDASGGGGLVGRVISADPDCVIDINNSANNGLVNTSETPADTMGGAVAVIEAEDGEINIENVKNKRDVAALVMAGGIVGRIENDNSLAEIHLTSVFNNASVLTTNGASGGLVGYATGDIQISQSKVFGDNVVYGASGTGGLVGDMNGSGQLVNISQSYVIDTVVADTTEGNANNIGGLVGYAEGITIADSYAQADVTAVNGQNIGGLIGSLEGDVTNSYAAGGQVIGDHNVGGLLGYYAESNTFENLGVRKSFSAMDVSGNDTNQAGLVGYFDTVAGGYLYEDYYDGFLANQSDCFADFAGTAFTVSGVCDRKNQSNGEPDYFKDNSTNAPFVITEDGWDFSTIWSTVPADYPRLEWDYTRPVAVISDCEHLQAMRFELDGDYVLIQDIDCTGSHNWNGGEGFLPIGSDSEPFSGMFDGGGHKISGLAINSDADNVGMFGVTLGATISSFWLESANDSAIVSAYGTTGAIIGTMYGDTTLDEVLSTTPMVTRSSTFGGLVGQIDCDLGESSAVIRNSASDALIQYRFGGEGSMGGAVGFIGAEGDDCPVTIDNVSSSGMLWYRGAGSFGGDGVGGLIGSMYSGGSTILVTDSHSSRDIRNASESAGGLIGTYYDDANLNEGASPRIHIKFSSANGDVTIDGERSYAGGLVAEAYGGEILDSVANGTVTGGSDLGGLVGYISGDNTSAQIARSFAENVVVSMSLYDYGYAGGLVGEASDATIKDSYTKSNIEVTGPNVGGVAGYMSGDIINSYSASTITTDDPYGAIGGLIGSYEGTDTSGGNGLLNNFSASIFDFDVDGGGGLTGIGGIIGIDMAEPAINLNTNYFDDSADYAKTNACAFRYSTPMPEFCNTVAAETFKSNATNHPFADDPGPNWDFNAIWVVVEGDYPDLLQQGPGAAHEITTCVELQAMQNELSGDFILANDIDCNDEGTENDASTWNGGQGFIPVGDDDAPFTGTFDGQGYHISGLIINSSSYDVPVGLFGSTNGALIQSVIITDSLIGSGTNVAGAFVGVAYDTNLYQVAATDSMIGTNPEINAPTGGLVGIIFGSMQDEITSSSNIVQSFVADSFVGGGDPVGGIAGVLVGSVTIDSYFDGSIQGRTAVGGITGYNAGSIVVSSYAAGELMAQDIAGGIAGVNDDGAVAFDFAAVSMDVSDDAEYAGGLVGQTNGYAGIFGAFYDQAITGPYPCTDVAEDYCAGTAVNEDGEDPAHFFDNNTVSPFDAGPPFWDFESVWSTRPNDYPVLQWVTAIGPVYNITNCDELQNMDADLYGDYTLMNDIDCSGTYGFEPVGRGEGIAFGGTLDGQGHSIDNLIIVQNDSDNVGLFGQTDGAYVHDFTVSGYIEGEGSVGAVVGSVYGDSTLARVGNHASVYGDNYYVGGLVGSSGEDASVSIEDSYNQGVVLGSRFVGGILGYSDYIAEIYTSYNSGDVSGSGDVGGIAGEIAWGGTVESTFNAGWVDAGNDHAAIVNSVGEVYFHNNYVDSDRSSIDDCINNVGNEECHVVNTNELPSATYFFNNTTNAPFTNENPEYDWDFNGTWITHRSGFPTLGVRSNYTITNCAELVAINNDLEGYYTLAHSIGPCGFASLAQDEPFQGVLDGNGNSINGLMLSGGYPKALFGFAKNASIANLTVVDFSTSGTGCGAALAGEADGIDIYNVSVQGSVNTENAGGLVGCIYSHTGNGNSIEKSSFTGSIVGQGASGGLVGTSDIGGGSTVNISNSYTGGTVSSNNGCGGLVGELIYEYDGLHSRDGVHFNRDSSLMNLDCNDRTGGLVGGINANGLNLEVAQSSFFGTIEANGGEDVGGLIGVYESNGHLPYADIHGSYAEASITGGGNNVGGLVGRFSENTSIWMADNYFKGDIEIDGQNGGGLVGFLNVYTSEIDSSYAAGSITNSNDGADFTPWTGGLVGNVSTGWFFGTFSAMDVVVDAAQPFAGNGFVGQADSNMLGMGGNYYNADTGTGECGYSENDSNYFTREECIPVSLQDYPDLWIANEEDAPLNDWQFGDIWHVRPNDYPSLSPSMDPQVQCVEVQATTSSLQAACSFATQDGILYGPTTWEMRYRKLNTSDDFLPWDVGEQPYFDTTITGLEAGTWYDIQFRHTDDRGVGDWLHIEAQTNSVSGNTTNASAASSSSLRAKKAKVVPVNDVTGEAVVTTVTDPRIVLNDFSEFLSGAGKNLQLKVGQVVYFMADGQEHSATVKEVGSGYVILTLASTPKDVRLNVGQTDYYDVTDDNNTDVRITLNSTKDGIADLTFAQVYHAAAPTVTTPAKSAVNWWWFVLVVAVGCAIILVLKKRQDKAANK